MQKSFLFKTTTAFILSLAITSSAFALGISPYSTEILNLKNTSSVESSFYASRSDATTEENYSVVVEGNGFEAIKLEIASITLGPETKKQEVKYLIEPVGFEPGSYEAEIQIESINHSSGATGLNLRLPHIVRFSVTNETVIEYSIKNAQPCNEKQKLCVTYRLENNGNEEASPAKIELKIKDSFDEESEWTTVTFEESDLEKIEAFTEKQLTAKSGQIFEPGMYKTQVTFFNDAGEEIFSNESNMQINEKENLTLRIAQLLLIFLGTIAVLLLSKTFRKK